MYQESFVRLAGISFNILIRGYAPVFADRVSLHDWVTDYPKKPLATTHTK
jgi:hypothetical protein